MFKIGDKVLCMNGDQCSEFCYYWHAVAGEIYTVSRISDDQTEIDLAEDPDCGIHAIGDYQLYDPEPED